MQRKMMCLALAGKWGGLGARGPGAIADCGLGIADWAEALAASAEKAR